MFIVTNIKLSVNYSFININIDISNSRKYSRFINVLRKRIYLDCSSG